MIRVNIAVKCRSKKWLFLLFTEAIVAPSSEAHGSNWWCFPLPVIVSLWWSTLRWAVGGSVNQPILSSICGSVEVDQYPDFQEWNTCRFYYVKRLNLVIKTCKRTDSIATHAALNSGSFSQLIFFTCFSSNVWQPGPKANNRPAAA